MPEIQCELTESTEGKRFSRRMKTREITCSREVAREIAVVRLRKR